MKNLLTITLCFFSLGAFAQMQVDKKIEMTGTTPSDKKIEGIEEVVNDADAANKVYVDTAIANRASSGGGASPEVAVASGSNGNYAVSLLDPPSAYTFGLEVHFQANHSTTGATTLDVNGLGPVPIKRTVYLDMDACDIMNGQMVTVVYDGTNFQMRSPLSGSKYPTTAAAGPDVSSGATSVVLAANTPENGTGTWSVLSGSGATFANVNDPTTTLTGVGGEVYTLQWEIATPCDTSRDQVVVSMPLVKVMFVTSTSYAPNVNADNTCNSVASGAGLSGTFKAFRFKSGQTINDGLNPAAVYLRTDGALIANSTTDMVNGNLLVPINLDENGNVRNANVWTGLDGSGISATSHSYHCVNWSENRCHVSQAYSGLSSSTATNWYSNQSYCCGSTNAWYCIEQ